MRLLVTGGAGFIGSAYVRMRAAASGDEITVFDALAYAGDTESIQGLIDSGRVRFVHGDVTDRHQIQAEVARHDAIVHFAALSHVDRSVVDAAPFLRVNAGGTLNILDSMREANPGARLIAVSTDEVYGEAPAGCWFAEDARLRPGNPYASAKGSADVLVLAYARTHGLDAIVTRCTNNYGPYQYPEKLLAMAITHALDDRPILIHGDGSWVRDWISVEDHCAALDVIRVRGAAGEVYNIAALCERSVGEIVGMACRAAGRDAVRLVKRIENRRGQDDRYAISPAKMMAQFDWWPGPPIEDRIEALVRWYAEHRAWWERIMASPHYKLHARRMAGKAGA